MQKLAVAAAAAATLLATSAGAQTVLKVHSFSGPQAPDQALHLFPWSEKINKAAGGRLKILAVSSLERSPLLPSVPTLVEQGIKDYEMNTWFGFIAPALFTSTFSAPNRW